MKERYGMIVLGAAFIIAAILMFACSSGPTVNTAPCCGEEVCDTYESEVIESIEEPDLTRDYEEVPSTQCVTCSLIIPNEIYGEHIKTCCPQEDTMKFEITDKGIKNLFGAFLALGACSYGCMFATYVLWFLGMVD